jgi:hypothetical protein
MERIFSNLESLDDHLVRLRVVALDGFRHPTSEPESGDLLTVVELEGGSRHVDRISDVKFDNFTPSEILQVASG